ncbi:MAG TPA: ribulose-phosphate 3-epimerase [Vicinamibacterales bacterium]|nr:ribulose-phosphate 3-epimerase [Vicinamibacterales bacterium]
MTSRSGQAIRLAPSILAADFANLGAEIATATRGGADQIHVDVMDGHFVPNITIGVPVVKSLRKATTLPLDVHLMITDPDRYIEPFIDAGANMVSVHVEVLPHLHRTITHIKKLGAKAGVVLNPSTPVSTLEDIAADVDFVLVMSVNPGFGGQVFIPNSLKKIQAVRALLDRSGNAAAPIEVDGGVDLSTVESVVKAGADWLVAGNAIFGAPNPEQAARTLKDKAQAAAGK